MRLDHEQIHAFAAPDAQIRLDQKSVALFLSRRAKLPTIDGGVDD
jgi:hypothetical protein